jgi:hypothetical protein
MKWLIKILNLITYWRKNVTLPIKDGKLDEDKIFAIYVVLDENKNPLYVVALTSTGPIIEVATPKILDLLKAYKREVIYYSVLDFVLHFHHSNALDDLKKKIKYNN